MKVMIEALVAEDGSLIGATYRTKSIRRINVRADPAHDGPWLDLVAETPLPDEVPNLDRLITAWDLLITSGAYLELGMSRPGAIRYAQLLADRRREQIDHYRDLGERLGGL